MGGLSGVRVNSPAALKLADDHLQLDLVGDAGVSLALEHPLSDIRFIAYESIGTRASVGAIAAFGVLGLVAREHWSLISIGLPKGTAQLVAKAPVHEVRQRFEVLSEESPTLTGITQEGPPPGLGSGAAEGEPGKRADVDELERLAGLYEKGMLTDAEFTAMKKKLIEGD